MKFTNTLGCLDGLTILRYAHAFESGGGLEQYLADLNSTILERNHVTVIQVQLTDNRCQSGKVTLEPVGAGQMFKLHLFANRFKESDAGENPGASIQLSTTIRRLLRKHIFNNYLLYPYLRPIFNKLYKPPTAKCEPLDVASAARTILNNHKVDLAVLHSPGGRDSRELMKELQKNGIPCALVNHFANDRFLHLSMRLQAEAADGVAGVNGIDVPRYLEPRFHNVSDGIDTDFFSRHHMTDASHCDGPPFVLLPARLVASKGHIDLIQAAGILFSKGIELRLIFAGRSDLASYEYKLKEMLLEYGMNSAGVFVGFQTPKDLREWYAVSHVVTLPTYHHEGLGRVLCEAQALETPVVAYDIGGVAEAFQHGQTGFLIRKGDVEGLAGAIGRLLKDDELRIRMGRNGREFVESQFSLRALAQRHEQFYQSVLEQSRQRIA